MPWITVKGRPVHVNTGGRRLTAEDERVVAEIMELLDCDHPRNRHRQRVTGEWICEPCGKEVEHV